MDQGSNKYGLAGVRQSSNTEPDGWIKQMAAKLDYGASHQSGLLNELEHNDDPVAPYTPTLAAAKPQSPDWVFPCRR